MECGVEETETPRQVDECDERIASVQDQQSYDTQSLGGEERERRWSATDDDGEDGTMSD